MTIEENAIVENIFAVKLTRLLFRFCTEQNFVFGELWYVLSFFRIVPHRIDMESNIS
jgi:hypothetical protein